MPSIQIRNLQQSRFDLLGFALANAGAKPYSELLKERVSAAVATTNALVCELAPCRGELRPLRDPKTADPDDEA